MRTCLWLVLAGVSSGCAADDVTEIQLQLEAAPIATVLLGDVDVEGFDGVSGRHYTMWAMRLDGSYQRVSRFVIVAAPEYAKIADKVVGVDAAQARDLDTEVYLGYVNTQCFNGGCGGIIFAAPEILSDVVEIHITREDDGTDEQQPSDDVFLRGPVQPFARGTLRGSLRNLEGRPTPRAEITLIPEQDETQF